MKYSTLYFLFLLQIVPLQSQNVIRGPYLQKGSASSMTIKWRTNSNTNSKIEYGTNLSNLNQNSADPGLKKNHELQVYSLQQNTIIE